MSCRVGMSTYPDARIKHWMKEEGHTHSEILASELTYKEAEELEKYLAEVLDDCSQHEGGEYVEGAVWFVYYVGNLQQKDHAVGIVNGTRNISV